MLLNLKNEMEKKKVTHKDLSTLLKISEKAVYLKLTEKTDFTLKEIKLIHRFLFPQYTFQYLFESDEVS